jgi:hypothetical protein
MTPAVASAAYFDFMNEIFFLFDCNSTRSWTWRAVVHRRNDTFLQEFIHG